MRYIHWLYQWVMQREKALIERIRIATRKSPLALWQAEHIKHRLKKLYPALVIELHTMVTKGDKILDVPLAKIGGKGLFVKELENALYNNEADIAVHSTKDLPMDLPKGLVLGAICEREDPQDALVSREHKKISELGENPVIGTSSLRRGCQLLAQFPHAQIKTLRGNVGTRLQKFDAGEYDAIILAATGLHRLGLSQRISHYFSVEAMLPAVGQGALSIECREDDVNILKLLKPLEHKPTSQCILAERSMNKRLEGGCQAPIAGHATLQGDQLRIRGLVGRVDGSHIVHGEKVGHVDQAEALGNALAEELLSNGAAAILSEIYRRDE